MKSRLVVKRRKIRTFLSTATLTKNAIIAIALLICLTNTNLFSRGRTSSRYNSEQMNSEPIVVYNRVERPPVCTAQQKEKIMNQLKPDKCDLRKPQNAYLQECSLTQATKCPEATWLTSYYKDLDRKRKMKDKGFVAVYVGCNKGYDAVNALRMGTGNDKYNKKDWHKHLLEEHESVCDQNENEFSNVLPRRDIINGQVHCIEPMDVNHKRLDWALSQLKWDDFLLSKAAIAKETGTMYMRKIGTSGVENRGLYNRCQNKEFRRTDPKRFAKMCDAVDVYTLDDYMEKVGKKKDSVEHIHLLSIDIEGFDFDAIQGGLETLKKTEYLEFEFNRMGSWKNQKLSYAISLLDGFGFTCYWAGKDKLWRLDTSCWLEHYEYHTWSNVACVNRHLNTVVAKNMEETFLRTLQEDVSY